MNYYLVIIVKPDVSLFTLFISCSSKWHYQLKDPLPRKGRVLV